MHRDRTSFSSVVQKMHNEIGAFDANIVLVNNNIKNNKIRNKFMEKNNKKIHNLNINFKHFLLL